MPGNTENPVLERRRALRNDITAARSEMRDGLRRMALRMGALETRMSGLETRMAPFQRVASDRDVILKLQQRVERIERRLELVD